MVDATNYAVVIPSKSTDESRDFTILATLGAICLGLIVVIWSYAASIGVDPTIQPPADFMS